MNEPLVTHVTAPVSSSSATHSLFGPHGRLVPVAGDRVYSQVDRRYFQLVQPAIDFATVRANVAAHLGADLTTKLPSADELAARCERLRAELLRSPATAGLFTGVHVPFVLLPETHRADLGQELEDALLPAVGRAYVTSYPKYEYRNHLRGQTAGELSIVPGTRYERLTMAHASRVICGWYFPTAMPGYAIPDQRTLVARMPESLILSGPLEASMAMIAAPALLMQLGNYPNLLALSAVQPRDPKMFHFFEAYGWNLTYNQRSMVGAVSEYFTGGFTVID